VVNQTNPYKLIENKFNVWWYIALLYLAALLGSSFEGEMTANFLLGQIGAMYGVSMSYVSYIFIRLLVPVMSVLLFEGISRLLFIFIRRNTYNLNVEMRHFVNALRLFETARLAITGLFGILFYFANFLIPLGLIIIDFIVSAVCYTGFFLYFNKNYLTAETSHKIFSSLATVFIIFNAITFIGGLAL